MKKYLMLSCLIVAASITINSITIQNPGSEVPYPTGYREWTHIKTGVIGPQSQAAPRFEGFHHIYANKKAMKGYSTGSFPDGSIIVFDVLESTDDGKGNTNVGNRKFIDVMVKDAARYDSTGGWGFEEFNSNSTTERNIKYLAKKQCFSCHLKQAKKDFVFSEFRK